MGDVIGGLGEMGTGIGTWAANNPGDVMRLAGQGVNMFAPQGSGIGNALVVGGDVANIGSAASGRGTAARETSMPTGLSKIPTFETSEETINPDYASVPMPEGGKSRPLTIGGSLETGMQDMEKIRQQQLARAAQLQQMFGNQSATPPSLGVVGGRTGMASPTSPVPLPNSAQLIAQILSAKPIGFTGFGG